MDNHMSDDELREYIRQQKPDESVPVETGDDFGYDEMIETLAAQLGASRSQCREAEKQALKYAHTLDNLRVAAIEIAAALAYAGSYPHKEKNEAILHAVARLLAMSTNYPKPRDDGDVPF